MKESTEDEENTDQPPTKYVRYEESKAVMNLLHQDELDYVDTYVDNN